MVSTASTRMLKISCWVTAAFSGGKTPLDLLDEVRERLARTGYAIMSTPFGYFNEFRMHVAGDSLAKVFKEF